MQNADVRCYRTVTGTCMGTSTVTSYIESASGVEAGGRTGLTSVFVNNLHSVILSGVKNLYRFFVVPNAFGTPQNTKS